MSLTADDVETIKNLIVDPLSRQIEGIQNQILAIHTPQSCPEMKDIKQDLKEVRKQQNRWLGGLSVIVGIGGLFIAFKDEIVRMIRG